MRILTIGIMIVTFKTFKFLSYAKVIVSMKVWIVTTERANLSLLVLALTRSQSLLVIDFW